MLIKFILRMALTQEIIAHNFASSAVFNICAISYSITNHVFSFHHVVWQNCATGSPGKVEIIIL